MLWIISAWSVIKKVGIAPQQLDEWLGKHHHQLLSTCLPGSNSLEGFLFSPPPNPQNWLEGLWSPSPPQNYPQPLTGTATATLVRKSEWEAFLHWKTIPEEQVCSKTNIWALAPGNSITTKLTQRSPRSCLGSKKIPPSLPLLGEEGFKIVLQEGQRRDYYLGCKMEHEHWDIS